MIVNEYSRYSALGQLSQDVELQTLLDKDAGVSEGYTVRQHTEKVLKTAQKYKKTFKSDVLKLVDWNEFLLFLALHDIGKGKAVEQNLPTALAFKTAELWETRAILTEVMSRLSVSPDKIDIFSAMLLYDTIGLYLKEEIGCDEAFDNILEMARSCNIDPREFFPLFQAFHAVDAASYPDLMQSIFTVRKGKLCHTSFNQAKLDDLNRRIWLAFLGGGISSLALKSQAIYENLEPLLEFLRMTNKEMLTGFRGRRYYQEINESFKTLFFNIIKKSKIKHYKKLCAHSLGRMDFHLTTNKTIDSLFLRKSTELGGEFFHELMKLRKNYLCRYSIETVEKAIHQQIQLIWEQKFTATSDTDQFLVKVIENGAFKITKDILSLLKVTFLHGTNSKILPILSKTGMALHPSGRLKKHQIVPMTGELEEGSVKNGVNQYLISGTSLDDGFRAIRYACDQNFYADIESEEEHLADLINTLDWWDQKRKRFSTVFKTENDSLEWGILPRHGAAIKRLRIFQSKKLGGSMARLKKSIELALQDFHNFKKTDEYKNHLMENGYHDAYYDNNFAHMESSLQELSDSLSDPVATVVDTSKPFPIIFGSTTLDTQMINHSEECSVKSAVLGKDIQMIFVWEKDQDKVTNLENLHVYSIQQLCQAILFNQLASPYMADIISGTYGDGVKKTRQRA